MKKPQTIDSRDRTFKAEDVKLGLTRLAGTMGLTDHVYALARRSGIYLTSIQWNLGMGLMSSSSHRLEIEGNGRQTIGYFVDNEIMEFSAACHDEYIDQKIVRMLEKLTR